jgi:hypothetical protein
MHHHRSTFVHRAPALFACLALAACGDDPNVVNTAIENQNETESGGPFKALAAAANSPDVFSQPRAGVPLEDGATAFIAVHEGASDEDISRTGPRSAVFLQAAAAPGVTAPAPSVLYAGDELVSPIDIEASADGQTLFVADYAGGTQGSGAILRLSRTGGEPSFAADGWSPRSVTLGADEALYFSGIDPTTGEPGIFRLVGDTVDAVFVGAPLVDPSGIAVFRDGRVLVADTRLLDGGALFGEANASEAGVVLVDRGQASIFASGFATGFPAGVALTLDESTLIISGQGPDRRDTVYLVNVAAPKELPTAVTDVFSEERDSSAGLKRAHAANTFIWASLSYQRGTVFRIDG